MFDDTSECFIFSVGPLTVRYQSMLYLDGSILND